MDEKTKQELYLSRILHDIEMIDRLVLFDIELLVDDIINGGYLFFRQN